MAGEGGRAKRGRMGRRVVFFGENVPRERGSAAFSAGMWRKPYE